MYVSKSNTVCWHYFKVSRFAREVIQPKVQAMDEAECMDKSVIDGMFENGVKLKQVIQHLFF